MGEPTKAPDWQGFGRAIMEEWGAHYDLEASEKFELAVRYNILREIPGGFDPATHLDEYEEAEPGDPWYEINDQPDRLAAENAELTTERDAALEWAERYEQVVAERDRLREAVLRWHLGEMGDADPDEAMAATAALADTARALSKGER